MQKLILIVILFALCILGFIRLVLDRVYKIKEREFSVNFLNKYREFSNQLMNDNFNNENYQWLKLNSAKMQKQMGVYGVVHAYKPAFSNYMYNNYEIIINGISHIRDLYSETFDFGLGRKVAFDEITGIDDVLLIYMGAIDNEMEVNMSEIKNPMIWLREGVRLIVTLPISLMYWSGLIRYSTYNSLSNNFFTKFISFLVVVIGLVSSIVTIATGYIPFWDIIKKFYN